MEIVIDAHEVHDLAGEMRSAAQTLPDRVELAVGKVGHDMQAMAQRLVPVDTGLLKQSISLDFTSGRGAGGRFHGGMGFDLGPTAEYGGYVELGVDHPFEITAHYPGFLAFDEGGVEVFTRKVEHPPIPPQPYLGPSFDFGLPRLESALGALGSQAALGRAA